MTHECIREHKEHTISLWPTQCLKFINVIYDTPLLKLAFVNTRGGTP